MEIASPPQTNKPAAQPSNPTAALSSDFETFLKMLTAQMRNQDPMNPVDSSDYAVQLATFSSVEQQVLTNDLLRDLGAQFALSGMQSLSSWIGMEARVSGPVGFNGAPLDVHFDIPATAQSASLIARDAQGREMHRQDVPTNADNLRWSGTGPDGAPLPAGSYSFEIEVMDTSGQRVTHPAESFARVTEARRGDSSPELVLHGGQTVAADEVSALREPA